MQDSIKILIVDDERDFLDAVQERLGTRGFQVTTVENGDEALSLTDSEQFDLALIDLQMPGMNGRDLLARLKDSHRYLEVIMLTGHGTIDSAVDCTKLGAFAYLTKPCGLDQLVQTLQDAYEHRLRRKFERDQARLQELTRIAMGESPLRILQRMRELDDEER
jgi:DNA-binding NtrC family response regulator